VRLEALVCALSALVASAAYALHLFGDDAQWRHFVTLRLAALSATLIGACSRSTRAAERIDSRELASIDSSLTLCYVVLGWLVLDSSLVEHYSLETALASSLLALVAALCASIWPSNERLVRVSAALVVLVSLLWPRGSTRSLLGALARPTLVYSLHFATRWWRVELFEHVDDRHSLARRSTLVVEQQLAISAWALGCYAPAIALFAPLLVAINYSRRREATLRQSIES
jgi:hypothetical protein